MVNNAAQSLATLRIAVRRSRYLLAFIVVTHTLGIVVVWFTALPLLLNGMLVLLVIASFLYNFSEHYWQQERVLTSVEGRWQLHSGGKFENVVPVGNYFITPWLLILPLILAVQPSSWFRKIFPRRTVLILLPDSANQDELRRLRALLNTY